MIDKLRRDIYVYQGTNCDFTFDIYVSGERYSLEQEDKLILTVLDYRDNNSVVITKEVTGSNSIAFVPSDYEDLDIGYYTYNVKLTQNATGFIYEVVSPSTFWIKAGE